ncbi:MAG: hypothetical protein WCF71_07735, partial [Verrucomicrobiia bacterium]
AEGFGIFHFYFSFRLLRREQDNRRVTMITLCSLIACCNRSLFGVFAALAAPNLMMVTFPKGQVLGRSGTG